MSELAFDTSGEPITFPADAEELRVRRFRSPGMRGACEVVHDGEGAPLYVPVDTGYVEFRGLVEGVPGRYRLDPVDAGRRVIANSLPAYVTITENPRNQASSGSDCDRDSIIRDLARVNADIVKTIADRFGSVMQAAADLLRAADGAGLPRREPQPAPVVELVDLDDEDEDDEDPEDENGGSPDVGALIAQLLPTLQMWLATKVAGKAARAVPATASAAAPTPVPEPATVVTADGEVGEMSGPDSARPPDPSPPRSDGASVRSGRGETVPEPAAVRNAALPTPVQAAHLLAIHARLSPDEKRVSQLVVRRMTPQIRADWLAEVSGLTVDQAVELVRSMIPTRPAAIASPPTRVIT